jgi:O-methyltransferase
MTKFGILSKFDVLQTIPSIIISKINPAIIHNIGKYMAIKKAFFLSSIEEIEGDYFEFGVFKGSSFCHAIRCAKANVKYDKRLGAMHFFGYDSFEGFGELQESDGHKFFKDLNFDTNFEKVYARVKRVADVSKFTLSKGYFEQTLKGTPPSKSRIMFIDSDTNSSATLALSFLRQSLQEGTIIILDDYFMYKGSRNKGVAGAFQRFCKQEKIDFRQIASYGIGGVIMIISRLNKS